MSRWLERRVTHPLFRPDPVVSPHPTPAGPQGDGLELRRARYAPAPWPWATPAPLASQPWAKVGVISEEGRDLKGLLLRVAGIILVVAGAGAIGFAAYANWSGNAAAERAQEQLAADFAQDQGPITTLPIAADDDPTIGSTSTQPSTTVTTIPGEDVAGPALRTTIPALVDEAAPPQGDALGRLSIPDAGIDWMIVEGVTQAALAKGPGHMPGTALPGQPGNAVISGHRTTYGAPFHDLHLLEPGDRITVQTTIGTHAYEVVELVIVAPTAIWVTNQVDGAWLTLTTCNPIGSARERLIVFARLIGGPNADSIEATLDGDEAPPRQG